MISAGLMGRRGVIFSFAIENPGIDILDVISEAEKVQGDAFLTERAARFG